MTLLAALLLSCQGYEAVPLPTPAPALAPPAILPAGRRAPRLPENVSRPPLSDVTYCQVDGVELKMDAYFPAEQGAPAPALVYVHGGGWNQGDRRSGLETGETALLTNAGFAVFAVNYRLAPAYRFPAMITDVKCAVRSIRAHAAEYNIDPSRIGALGASAGGHLAALLGTADSRAGFDTGEFREYSSRVQAVVDIFGPADLTLQNFSAAQVHSASQVFTAEQLVPASPVTHISPDDPPFLIIHGDHDTVVPLEQSQILYSALIASDVPAELVIVHNAGHGFQAEAQTQPDYWQISARILGFLKSHLK